MPRGAQRCRDQQPPVTRLARPGVARAARPPRHSNTPFWWKKRGVRCPPSSAARLPAGGPWLCVTTLRWFCPFGKGRYSGPSVGTLISPGFDGRWGCPSVPLVIVRRNSTGGPSGIPSPPSLDLSVRAPQVLASCDGGHVLHDAKPWHAAAGGRTGGGGAHPLVTRLRGHAGADPKVHGARAPLDGRGTGCECPQRRP